MKCAHSLRIVFVIGKYTYISRRNFVLGVGYHRENFPWEGTFPGDEFSMESFTLGRFDRIPKGKSCYLSYIMFAKSISNLEVFRGIYPGAFSRMI